MSKNMSQETKLAEKSKRVKRKRIEKAGPLYIDDKHKEEGFHYRIVNDTAGEVNRRIRMGYEIVQDTDVTVGDQVAGTSSRLGSAVTLDVGVTRDVKGVLMRCPNEVHSEILDELNEEADLQEEAIFGDSLDGLEAKERKTLYGGVKKD